MTERHPNPSGKNQNAATSFSPREVTGGEAQQFRKTQLLYSAAVTSLYFLGLL